MNLTNLGGEKNMPRNRRMHPAIAKKVNLTDIHLAVTAAAVVAVENEIPQAHRALRHPPHHPHHHRILMLKKG